MLKNFTEDDVLQDILAKEAEADQVARDAATAQGFDLNDDAGREHSAFDPELHLKGSQRPAQMPLHPPGAGTTKAEAKPPPRCRAPTKHRHRQ